MKQKQEIRKGFEWFRTLTKKQQKRFRLECHRRNGVSKFQDVMNSDISFYGFVAKSFMWNESGKGFYYWYELASR